MKNSTDTRQKALSRFGEWAALCAVVLGLTLYWMPVSAKAPAGTEPLAKSLLWEVSGNGLEKSSYLFGTFHILKESYLDKVGGARERLQAADGVVTEILMDESEMMKVGMMMLMPDNSLKDLLSKKDYKKLEKAWKKKTGSSLGMMNKMKPNALMMQLMDYSAIDDYPEFADMEGDILDMGIAKYGKSSGKQVHGLETLEHQVEVLMGSPVEEQAEGLMEVVRAEKEMKKQSVRLIELYINRDLEGMQELMLEAEAEGAGGMTGMDTDALLADRNNAWVEKLPGLMQEGSQFVAVGAMHLAGETGLITQLRALGYTVTPVQQ